MSWGEKKSTWTHLVRIEHEGQPTFAHLVDTSLDGDLPEQLQVNIATGDPVKNNIVLTNKIVTVARKDLLAPFHNPPIVINTGLNYNGHVKEAEFYIADLAPPRPYIFYRPGRSIAPPYPVDLRAYRLQTECLDYEGELVFQTGSTPLKNISIEEAKKHIVGFTTGCDFSPRPGKLLGKHNFIFSKAFDEWTPAGPVLVHPSITGIIPELDLTTKWNGKVVQSDNTRNMTFNVAQILSAMSTGTTVEPGTVVYSGTTSGGAWFNSQGAQGTGIQDGDEIDVRISKIGNIRAYPKFDPEFVNFESELGLHPGLGPPGNC